MSLGFGTAGENDFKHSFKNNKEDFFSVKGRDFVGHFPVNEFHSAVKDGLSLSGFVVKAESESFDNAVPVFLDC